MSHEIKDFLKNLVSKGKMRSIQHNVASSDMLNFGHNNYLGLAKHPSVIEAVCRSVQKEGVGSTGSRLLSGANQAAASFEMLVSESKSMEASLLFSSGYQANITVLPSLLSRALWGSKKIMVFFDKKNHVSLLEGVLHSDAEMYRYPHNNMAYLEKLLQEHSDPQVKFYIVTEVLFGVNGDKVDLSALYDLAKRYNATLYLDESHSVGLCGPEGYGVVCDKERQEVEVVIMGSLGKALGCAGAYVSSSQAVKDYLVNTCKGLMFSTSLPAFLWDASSVSWKLVALMDAERKNLQKKSDTIRSVLTSCNYDVGESEGHIIPIFFLGVESGLCFWEKLRAHGIQAAFLRPPTVREGTSCVRISVSVLHTEEQVEFLCQALGQI